MKRFLDFFDDWSFILFAIAIIALMILAIICGHKECGDYTKIQTRKPFNRVENCVVYEIQNCNLCGSCIEKYVTICPNGKTQTSWLVPHFKSVSTTEAIEVIPKR